MENKEFENKTKKMKEYENLTLINNSNNNSDSKDKVEIEENKNKYHLSFNNNTMDNRRLVYRRIEGEQEENLTSESQNDYTLNVNPNKNKSRRKIGTNIVLFKKYVLGTRKNFLLILATISGMAITWFGWAITNSIYLSFTTIIICFISYFLTNYYMVLSFLTEPGIIPRECPEFSKKNLEENINEDINKDNKEENKEIIPKIFQERSCTTCNIIRPPGTSHCRVCNNCVQNFDHHCFFISNCVGKRNHKYFYLFLIWGTIGSSKMVILGWISLYKLFIINAHETIFIYYKHDKKLSIICMCFIAIGLLFCMCSNIFCLTIQFIIAFIIYYVMWLKYSYGNNNTKINYNPFIIAFYIGSIYFFGFVISTFWRQSDYISSGYTIKQTQSIRDELMNIYNSKSNNKLKDEFIRKRTFKEKVMNIIKFLKADNGPSLIIPERDLIRRK